MGGLALTGDLFRSLVLWSLVPGPWFSGPWFSGPWFLVPGSLVLALALALALAAPPLKGKGGDLSVILTK